MTRTLKNLLYEASRIGEARKLKYGEKLVPFKDLSVGDSFQIVDRGRVLDGVNTKTSNRQHKDETGAKWNISQVDQVLPAKNPLDEAAKDYLGKALDKLVKKKIIGRGDASHISQNIWAVDPRSEKELNNFLNDPNDMHPNDKPFPTAELWKAYKLDQRDAKKRNVNEGKSKFEVKYAKNKKGPIKVSKFMTKDEASAFLAKVQKQGFKGIISVGGKPIKEASRIKIHTRVQIKPGKKHYHGKLGTVGEIQQWHDGEKRYTIDYEDDRGKRSSVLLRRKDFTIAKKIADAYSPSEYPQMRDPYKQGGFTTKTHTSTNGIPNDSSLRTKPEMEIVPIDDPDREDRPRLKEVSLAPIKKTLDTIKKKLKGGVTSATKALANRSLDATERDMLKMKKDPRYDQREVDSWLRAIKTLRAQINESPIRVLAGSTETIRLLREGFLKGRFHTGQVKLTRDNAPVGHGFSIDINGALQTDHDDPHDSAVVEMSNIDDGTKYGANLNEAGMDYKEVYEFVQQRIKSAGLNRFFNKLRKAGGYQPVAYVPAVRLRALVKPSLKGSIRFVEYDFNRFEFKL